MQTGDPFEEEVCASSIDLEFIWKDVYEKRRDTWKKKVVELHPNNLQSEHDNPTIITKYNVIQNAYLFQPESEILHIEPQFGRNIPLSNPDHNVAHLR